MLHTTNGATGAIQSNACVVTQDAAQLIPRKSGCKRFLQEMQGAEEGNAGLCR